MTPADGGAPRLTVPKSKRRLIVVSLIGGFAFITGSYCFWLMTVPLSYDWVYIVVSGFLLSLLVFVVALVAAFVLAIRSRRTHDSPAGPEISNSKLL